MVDVKLVSLLISLFFMTSGLFLSAVSLVGLLLAVYGGVMYVFNQESEKKNVIIFPYIYDLKIKTKNKKEDTNLFNKTKLDFK